MEEGATVESNLYNSPAMDHVDRVVRRHHLEHPKRLDRVRVSVRIA